MGIDLIMGSDGDLTKISLLGTGLAEIGQRIQIRLNTQLGGWPLDPSKGIDYQGAQQTRALDDRAFGAIIKAEIESTPGVITVLNWTGTRDVEARSLSYTGEAITDEGQVDLLVDASPALTGNSAAHVIVNILSSGAIVGGA